jgi:exosortase
MRRVNASQGAALATGTFEGKLTTDSESPVITKVGGPWSQLITLLLLIGLIYWRVLPGLVEEWWNNPDFSHGFLVPVFAAFVIWCERNRLKVVPVKPSWVGLAIIALGLAALIVGLLGAELFSSRSSLIVLLFGLVIYFFGWRWARALLFPLACLFLMIPIPAILFNHLTFPMQLFASRFATSLLPFFGVPVLREGNVLQLPSMALEVAEACSGIRSLTALITLAIILGYLSEKSTARRLLLALAAFPIAIVANGLRVVGTGLSVQYGNPSLAEGFFHSFEGWLVFLVSVFLLFLLHVVFKGLDRLAKRDRHDEPI